MPAINYSGDVAVIGMSGAFPGARTLDDFHDMLRHGREAVRFLSDQEQPDGAGEQEAAYAKNSVPAVAAMDDVELFDASFFGMTAEEAEITDPQHRLLLEHCWKALEHAGYDTHRYSGRIGIFAGATINTYLMRNLLGNTEVMASVDPLQLNIANGADFLTTRISYKLNLKGPSHTVQSACSTSLVAVHCGCRSLLDAECDIAVAGGVSVNVTLSHGYRYQDGGIMSPDGHCRAFDAGAGGTIFGSGVGVVVLRRLEDALAGGDCVHAVIKGSAVNNDGCVKAGYTAPSVEGQAEVIAEAIGNAGVDPGTIGYVECHGTGTVLGDPIEIRALRKAFGDGTQQHGFCAVGSVKSNIGHLDAAAGIAGLMKVVLALKHGVLFPTLHFQKPNPAIDFENSPFYVNTRLIPWNRNRCPRRAGVSAFGVGGTNAHVVLEEAPPLPRQEKRDSVQLLPLSGRTGNALRISARNLAVHLRCETAADLASVAYTLQTGRRQFAWRWAGLCHSREEAVALLETAGQNDSVQCLEEGSRKVAFLFPGQGSQYHEMGKELYENDPVFSRHLRQCSEILRSQLRFDLCSRLYETSASASEIEETSLAQPALLSLQYALAQLWQSWGVQPQAMIGHSLGEYTAACIAGVMTLEDALAVVAARGRLMQRMPASAMLAVYLSASQLGWATAIGASVAAINAPELCTVSGTLRQIQELEERLVEKGVAYRRLQTSHAFHSSLVEPLMPEFLRVMETVKLKRPSIPYISNVTGSWIRDDEAQDPRYWVQHLREPVQFACGLKQLFDSGQWMLLEVGPGQSLKRLAQAQGSSKYVAASLSGATGTSEMESLLSAAAQIWTSGIDLNWDALHGEVRHNRVPLPTYPFERKRYWIEPDSLRLGGPSGDGNDQAIQRTREHANYAPRPPLRNAYVAPASEAERQAVAILERALGITRVGVTDQYGELGGDSLTAMRVIDQLNRVFHSHLRVVDLYEGLSVRDLMCLIEAQGAPSDALETAPATDRRRVYQQRRRSLHRSEPA